ncbi:MAG: alpha/beta hydrolase [Hyphomicrobiales bacterium]|nr:alpha/beta hydrolase [Hyphomicrobiales bacterium]
MRPSGEAVLELIGTPGNPVPDGAIVSAVGAADGVFLRIARWAPGPDVAGTICVFTGRGEFIEKYFETIRELVARNFSVVAMDWRGQGGSARELPDSRKGHIDDFSMFERDLEALYRQVLQFLCPRPWFALAHSMGGSILLSQARSGNSPFERLVLTSPMIEIGGPLRRRSARGLVELADIAGFGAAFAPGQGRTSAMTRPFAGNNLTSDPVRYARNAEIVAVAPHLAVGGPTIGWTNAALRLTRRLTDPEFARRTTTPVLIFGASEDKVVSTPATARFANQLKAGGMVLLPGARHEILQERDEIRSQFWAAFDAFIPGARDRAQVLQHASETAQALALARPWWRRMFGPRRAA